jgi:hypothetical protein
MRAQEPIVLDQNGKVIAGGSFADSSPRTPIAWGAGGLFPKIMLAVAAGVLLFLGFGIASVVLLSMLILFLMRTIFSFFTGSGRPRSKFTFVIKR